MIAVTRGFMAPPLQGLQQQSIGKNSSQDNTRPYKCPLCNKAFHRLEHQSRHIRTHTGEKPYACTYSDCTKRFARSDELVRHSKTHNKLSSRRAKVQHNTEQFSGSTTKALPKTHAHRSTSSSSVGSRKALPPDPLSSHSPDADIDLIKYRKRGLSDGSSVGGLSEYLRYAGLRPPTHASNYSHEGRHWCSCVGNHPRHIRIPDRSLYTHSSQARRELNSCKDENHYAEKTAARSSTSIAPPSPHSPKKTAMATPTYIPLATHTQPPQSYQHGSNKVELSPRQQLSLSLDFVPTSAPIKPLIDQQPLYVPDQPSNFISGNMVTREMSQQKECLRKVPKISVQDLLNDVKDSEF